MSPGFFKIHRKIKKWEWYSEPNVFCLFMHLLTDANFEDRKWQGKTIKAGQLVTGRSTLAISTGLSEQQIRTALNKLKSTGEITVQSTNSYSIITVTNWRDYQDNNQQDNQRITSEQPASNQRITTPKEVKNIRNKEYNNKNACETKSDFQKVYDFGSEKFPRLATGQMSPIHQWLNEGCSVELDIIPEIERAYNSGKTVYSWDFLTEKIAYAKAKRETPLPQGNTNNSSNHNGASYDKSKSYSNIGKGDLARIAANEALAELGVDPI